MRHKSLPDYLVREVAIGDVNPSTYNPRDADPKRLEIVELSLRKLGFVLPIVANLSGEIISGHQRHHVALGMGLKSIPVQFIDVKNLADRKAMNLLFNRATNDQSKAETPKELTERLMSRLQEFTGAAVKMPDVIFDTDRQFPCLHAELEDVSEVAEFNQSRFSAYEAKLARMAASSGIIIPLVVDGTGRVINGIGRVQHAVEKLDSMWVVVRLEDEQQARLAEIMLNLLTMEFNVHDKYADFLRHNSFRRSRGVKKHLGTAYTFDMGILPTQFFPSDTKLAMRWRRHYGTQVMDFGCGLDTERNFLAKMGVETDTFEPYRLSANDCIDAELSRVKAVEFLEKVAASKQWSSVFQNSVMNSIPFQSDREHVIRIIASLCGERTKFYCCAASVYAPTFRTQDSEHDESSITSNFKLSYEKNVTIGSFTDLPKVQKYHDLEEWRELMQVGFEDVFARYQQGSKGLVMATCTKPKPVDLAALQAALEFEFDLPYPDGSRLGLAEEAKRAWEQRLGIKFAK